MDKKDNRGLYMAARVSYGLMLILFVVCCMTHIAPTWVAEIVIYAYIGFLIYVYSKVRNDDDRRYRVSVGVMIAVVVVISFAPLYIEKLEALIA